MRTTSNTVEKGRKNYSSDEKASYKSGKSVISVIPDQTYSLNLTQSEIVEVYTLLIIRKN